jgi:hypothetical protein
MLFNKTASHVDRCVEWDEKIMYNEMEGMRKEVIAYFKVLFWY